MHARSSTRRLNRPRTRARSTGSASSAASRARSRRRWRMPSPGASIAGHRQRREDRHPGEGHLRAGIPPRPRRLARAGASRQRGFHFRRRASDRPEGAGRARGAAGSNSGEGRTISCFELSREEFLNFFFDDLALPNLVKTQLTAHGTEFKTVRAGYTTDGTPSNINVVRSLRGAHGAAHRLGRALPRRSCREARGRHWKPC